MTPVKEFMHGISTVFEIAGVACILVGFLIAIVRAGLLLRTSDGNSAYRTLRHTFGYSILLGLEILVAADLIRTIAVEPTLSNLAVLAVLVGIRTLLSWSLEVEIEGRWPWRRAAERAS